MTVDTKAIQQAINNCFAAGGGAVILKAGTFVSGTLFLRANVYLQINASAILLASPNIVTFPILSISTKSCLFIRIEAVRFIAYNEGTTLRGDQ